MSLLEWGMNTDQKLLFKSLKYFAFTVASMFTAPIIIYQAFKNQEHSFYYPVLIIGLILAITAIILGFYSVKTLMDAIFKNKS